MAVLQPFSEPVRIPVEKLFLGLWIDCRATKRILIKYYRFAALRPRVLTPTEEFMRKLVASALVGTILLGATTAYAGGPVILEEGNPEVVAESPKSGFILPLIIGLVVVCAIACGGGNDEIKK